MTECPECGGSEWSTASDGLGSVASVAAVCVGCGYLTTSVVDVSNPPESAQLALNRLNKDIDAALARIGRDLTQQHMAAEGYKRRGLDDRHNYSEFHRMQQGRWGFYESARLICQYTGRDFEAFLREHDPRHEEYDR